jgi:hypothetical protein
LLAPLPAERHAMVGARYSGELHSLHLRKVFHGKELPAALDNADSDRIHI